MKEPQIENKNKDSLWTLIREIWCSIFHVRDRHRTGTWRAGKSRRSIFYDIKCDKCGVEDVEWVQWIY